MAISDRLVINFDTSKFGESQNLSSGASNTLNLIADTSGKMPAWQENDLAAGPVNRANYFYNRTVPHTTIMLSQATSIFDTANLVGEFTLNESANNLIIELAAFQSHTDNVSGAVEVANTYYPSLQSAQNIGQLNMMTLAKTSQAATNTAPILGSFTSLYIQDELLANSNQLTAFANEFKNSIVVVETPPTMDTPGSNTYSSNLTSTQINTMEDYINSTTALLQGRRLSDWDFYQRSVQMSKDVSYMSQFNNMGGTMSHMVNEVCGTQALKDRLNS